MLGIYVDEAQEPFDEDQLEKVEPEEVGSEMYYALNDTIEEAFDYKTLRKEDPRGYRLITALRDYVKELGHIRFELESLLPRPEDKGMSLKEASKTVETFLNGSWIKTLAIQRIGMLRNSSKIVPETYGIYDKRKNTAEAALEDDKAFAYMNRTSAISQWFASELNNYNKHLRGIAGGKAPEDDPGMQYISDLLTGISKPHNCSSERDWAEGNSVTATLTGANLPGVALAIDPVNFSSEETKYMANQIVALDELANKAESLCVVPNEIHFGKNICVKLTTAAAIIENVNFKTYDLSLLKMDRPAEKLVGQLKAVLKKPEEDRPELITGLFYGIPGSGKSLLANYIGEQLNMPVIKKTYAELQSMYVGEGEKQLTEAFAEAEAEGAILLIDEIDSVAGNRQNADKNYQKTFTNQLLTELDDFKGIFLATSNNMEGLDSAVLRRLFLKVKFDFLDEDQVEKAFKLYFPKLKRSKLGFIKYLTPGDFKAVREACRFDEKKTTVVRVRELLNKEVELKKITLRETIAAEKTVGYHL